MARMPRVADEAVRDYLEALDDPMTAVDWDEVEELERQISSSRDPVQRVLLRARWRETSDPATYMPQLESDFIAYAKQWADANGASGDDFVYEGVPAAVLEQAGMAISPEALADIEAHGADYAAAEFATGEAEPAATAPRAADPILATGGADGGLFEAGSAMEKVYALMEPGPFTINDLVDKADTSRSTVRAAIEKLIEVGRMEELPPLDTGTSGRSPKRFQLV